MSVYKPESQKKGSRPDYRMIIRLLFGLSMMAMLVCWPGSAPVAAESWKQLSLSGQTMGTTYHVKIVVPSDKEADPAKLQADIDAELLIFTNLLSTYDPNSELSRFNIHSSTEPFPISKVTLEILKNSFELYRESGGAFDPTVGPLVDLWGFGSQGQRLAPPSPEAIARATAEVGMDQLILSDDSLAKRNPNVQVNLSAIAPGYGVDIIAKVLKTKGFEDAMVEIGGEIVVQGLNRNRLPWTIGVDSPNQQPGQRELVAMLSLNDCAVATSGDYRNSFEYEGILYSHILDPKSGWPIPESIKSVTVVAPNCMLADGAATAIMAMGVERGLEWVEGRSDLEALIFVKDDKKGYDRLQTSGMEKYLVGKNK